MAAACIPYVDSTYCLTILENGSGCEECLPNHVLLSSGVCA